MLVAQSCPILWDHMDFSLPGSSVQVHSPGKITGVGSNSLLMQIFWIQRWNPGFLHCKQILHHLNHQGDAQLKGRRGIKFMKMPVSCHLGKRPWRILKSIPQLHDPQGHVDEVCLAKKVRCSLSHRAGYNLTYKKDIWPAWTEIED